MIVKVYKDDETIKFEGKKVAYEGCHKIYIIEDEEDEKNALKFGYKIYDIKELPRIYDKSCSLRFIYNWKLTNYYVGQFEDIKMIEVLDCE